MYTFFMYFISIKFKAKNVSWRQRQRQWQWQRKCLMYWLRLHLGYLTWGCFSCTTTPPSAPLSHRAPLKLPSSPTGDCPTLPFGPATLKFQLLKQNDKWTCSRKFLLCLLSRPAPLLSLGSYNQKPLWRQPTKCVGVAHVYIMCSVVCATFVLHCLTVFRTKGSVCTVTH